jgi:hypothetical protein
MQHKRDWSEPVRIYSQNATFRVHLVHPDVRSMSETFRVYLLHLNDSHSCNGPAGDTRTLQRSECIFCIWTACATSMMQITTQTSHVYDLDAELTQVGGWDTEGSYSDSDGVTALWRGVKMVSMRVDLLTMTSRRSVLQTAMMGPVRRGVREKETSAVVRRGVVLRRKRVVSDETKRKQIR